MNETTTPLKVFLCYASMDKPKARKLYHYLKKREIQPWFDEVDLFPGTDWEREIQREIAASDIIIICLTKNSINKQGYFQKEIGFALDRAQEMPEGQIFIIPIKFEDCELPHGLRHYQYWDLSAENDYAKLLKSLELRASQLGRTPVKLRTTASNKHDSSSEKSRISKERVLEAAIQQQVIIRRPTSLFVWVRRRGSKNIISVVKSTDEDVHLSEKDVKTNELEIEFPVKNGQTLPAEITLRLDAPEFEPSPQQKKIYVPPHGDSKVCRFVVTPKTTGELVLILEVLKGEFSVGSKELRTTAIDKEKKIDNPIVLMIIPVLVLAQSPSTLSDVKFMTPNKSIPEKKDLEAESPKPPTNVFPWSAVLGFLGMVLAAYIGFIGIRQQITIPIDATRTAEAKSSPTIAQTTLPPTDTPQPTFTLTSTKTPTQFICLYQGQTDNETIMNLIKAEATAVNTEDLNIILTIFAPDAKFFDHQTAPPKIWEGPIKRYRDDLFINVDFRGVEHFDISPVEPGIATDTAYYVSGSRGSYRVGGADWTPFSNQSIPSTQYGSDHWVLEKDNNGCWIIVRMELNAGHIKFP